MRGRFEEDQDTFSIIMECESCRAHRVDQRGSLQLTFSPPCWSPTDDNPEAFQTHYFNSAFQAMINSEYRISKLRLVSHLVRACAQSSLDG